MMNTINRTASRASFNTNQMAKMATRMPTISAVVGIQGCEECNSFEEGIMTAPHCTNRDGNGRGITTAGSLVPFSVSV